MIKMGWKLRAAPRRAWQSTTAMLLGSTACLLVIPSGEALAQQREGSGEIVVTAQRREQAVMDVPISVSVVSAAKIQTLNLSTFTSVAQQTPNFNITFERGANSAPDLSIRGVRGDGSTARVNESSVAVYVDDIYLGDENSLAGHMFDVQRVEVLRGPQGTLFGRNTTGGLVQFVSAAPTAEFTQKASVLYGSDNWLNINGAVSGALSPGIRTRLAGQFETHDGHHTNRATLAGVPRKLGAREVWSVRSTTDFDIGDASSLRLQVTHSETDSESTPNYGPGVWRDASRALCSRAEIFAARCVDAIVLGGQPPITSIRPGDAITELTRDELAIKHKLTSATAKFETDLGGASLINIANYTHFKSRVGLDGDGTTPSTLNLRVYVQLFNESEQFSDELRLQGESQAFDWVAGVFYYQDKKKNRNVVQRRTNTNAASVIAPSNARVDTTSGAAFGQIDWRFADRLTLTTGARYTIENRELVTAVRGATQAGPAVLPAVDVRSGVADPDPVTKDVTGRVSLTFEATPDHSLYGSYSRGAKSVGYSVFYVAGSLAENAAKTGPVGQEHVNAFEIGSKNRLFDRTLSLNLAAFYYLFNGKQELLTVAGNQAGGGIAVLTQFINVGRAEMYGAEVELDYKPNERWDFNFSGGLLRTEITKSPVRFQTPLGTTVPLVGRPLPATPKWNLSASIAHHIPVSGVGTFTLQADGRAQAKQNTGLSNISLADIPSYGLVNFRVMWESEDQRFNVQAFVTNAFKKTYFNGISDANLGAGSLLTQVGEPRLWGVKLGANF
ncbi:TonB-dependent receptor [Rhizorhabdus dicambivorans]|uniref:TonB-dependent receptor n=1 Tax=Rhizorhabdus dicambivorans TaxID=1850238 RepID=A0A2A4G2E7_9SPHN|nr:TonB-dependent receptor [Rhizorhabdus dicambivorans]ATE66559.1 TonB-dependent receptor [Rhizorhabdus dicambivorans]PCE43957.1 TonB-dependent receptor [Rhizorhabdus dicambivorans]